MILGFDTESSRSPLHSCEMKISHFNLCELFAFQKFRKGVKKLWMTFNEDDKFLSNIW